MLALAAVCSLVAPAPAVATEGTPVRVVSWQPAPCPPPGLVSDYAPTMDFGDGTPVAPATIPDERTWLVVAKHTYRRAGTYRTNATITRKADGVTIAVIGRDWRVKNAPLTKVATRRPLRNQPNQTLAKFNDGNRLAQPADFTATVNGKKAKVVKLGPGRFAIKGTAPKGKFTVRVEDDRGAKLSFG